MRKENINRNINKTQTITQTHFVMVVFVVWFMCVCFAGRKIRPYFAQIRPPFLFPYCVACFFGKKKSGLSNPMFCFGFCFLYSFLLGFVAAKIPTPTQSSLAPDVKNLVSAQLWDFAEGGFFHDLRPEFSSPLGRSVSFWISNRYPLVICYITMKNRHL